MNDPSLVNIKYAKITEVFDITCHKLQAKNQGKIRANKSSPPKTTNRVVDSHKIFSATNNNL